MIQQASNLIRRDVIYAPEAWRLLNGYFCLYKPPRKGFGKTGQALRQKIVQDLNSMECRPPREHVVISGDIEKTLQVEMRSNLADHVLVSGERYQEEHLSLWLGNNPGWYSSGLVVGCVGPSVHSRKSQLNRHRFAKIYELKGRFGFASNNFLDTGKIIAKSTFKHLKRDTFDAILCKIEAAQRQQMFKAAGVDLGSEEAYKIATNGWAPPATGDTLPVIYSMRTTSFELPDFTIEIQCSNESEAFLAEFINEIGLAMKSMAMCTGIRLVEFGPFNVEHSLLKKHWNLENIIENIHLSNKLFDDYKQQQQQQEEGEDQNIRPRH